MAQQAKNVSTELGAALFFKCENAPKMATHRKRIQGKTASNRIYPKNQNGWRCWKTGVKYRSKLCCQRKTRRKSGLRDAHSTYQGRAVAQNTAMISGCRKRNGARHWRESAAHISVAPPARITAAGPFASTAAPRINPNATRRKGPGRGFCNISLAIAIAAVNKPANSMSGLAAREKPIIATDVGSIRSEYQAAPTP